MVQTKSGRQDEVKAVLHQLLNPWFLVPVARRKIPFMFFCFPDTSSTPTICTLVMWYAAKTEAAWEWGERQRRSVATVWRELASVRVLAHFEPTAQLVLAVAAGPTCLGAGLWQRDDADAERPLAYASRSLAIMYNSVNTGFKNFAAMPTFVLDEYVTQEDVGRAMILNGRQKQPFYIFNMDEAFNRIQHFRDLMPRVKIFYAVKSNDSKMLLKLAISQGLGFDCASPGEIYKLRQLNVCPTSIIYAMTTKTPEQMIYARESGVRHTTFDTSYELKKLVKYWPDARLLIRVRVESDCIYKLGDKFGCDVEVEAVDLLEEAAKFGLKVVGVAFHVGSVCFSPESYAVGLQYAKTLFDHEARNGRGMKILDIGGGFLGERTESIDQVAKLINTKLEELFPDPDIQVIAEPGRYVSNSAFTLYCNINNIRRVKKDGRTLNMIYINDGVHGSFRYPEKWHIVSKLKWSTKKELGAIEEAVLWGPSCDPNDRVPKDFTIHLPRCMPLDWLIFQGVGAYTMTFSTTFSSLEIPLIRSVVSAELWNMIKESEIFNPKDFVTNPDIASPLPLTLPPVLPKNCAYKHSHTPTLKL